MEKTTRRAIAAIIALTVGFVLFSGGYWFGSRQLSGGYVVTSEMQAALPEWKPDDEPLAEYGKIDINTASAELLETLNGIGPKLAERIIEFREANGSFRHTYELLDINGIGVNLYVRIRDQITVGSVKDV